MNFRHAALAALFVVSACASSVPDSNPNAGDGVGFGGYGGYTEERLRRDAQLERRRPAPVPEEQVIAADTIGVLNQTRPAGTAPVAAATGTGDGTAPLAGTELVRNNPNISDEQNFDAVASRETIESDRERLRQQRDAFAVIQPEAVPERPGGTGPNIVAYALSTTNRVGEAVHRRDGGGSESQYRRACARLGSSDKAQETFLASGGPRRDPKGLDPDGDGFACFWDPAPFRAARGG